MELDLHELKTMFDKAYQHGQLNRGNQSNDMTFYYVTQWDDDLLADSTLGYKGEFNVLKKAGREILSDLSENPIQIDFVPKGDTSEDTAETLDGMYRTQDSLNSTLEAYEMAENEAVVCGFGAWEIDTEYESIRGDNKNQVIIREPIFESCNTVFFDPDSKRIDKSDADFVFRLNVYTEDGYKKLVNDLTGEELDEITPSSFKQPERSYNFSWNEGGTEKIYVGTCFHRKKIQEKIITMIDPFGGEMVLTSSDLIDILDEMLEEGFTEVPDSEKKITVWEVTKYIVSGAGILSSTVIAGEHLRIVPFYGEYAYINGEPHQEGVTRLAKDPSRLRNFAMSYLGDILSRSPRPKPIFWQEQIGRFAGMYENNGADNNYPYLLMERKSEDGVDLPIGPVAMMPEQTVPQSLVAVLGETRAAVADVANTGMVEDVADVDLSGKAVNALNARIDKQSFVYQTHKKHAKRRDSEIYVSIAKEIFDVKRTVTITLPDGTRKEATLMDSVTDKESGDTVIINDLRSAEFEIFSEIGIKYSSQKEQTIEQLTKMYVGMAPGDPLQKAVELKLITLLDGADFKDLKDYSNKQLILLGFKDPETDEEKAMLKEAQSQPKEPDATMVLAQAEQGKADAANDKNKIEMMKVQANGQNEELKRMIEKFGKITDRMAVQVDAQEAGATIDNKRADTFGKQLANMQANQVPVSEMSDEALERQMAG